MKFYSLRHERGVEGSAIRTLRRAVYWLRPMIGGWQVEKRTKRVLTTEHSISHIVQSTTPRERSKNSSTCCWYMA
jgi:hypothetical protein